MLYMNIYPYVACLQQRFRLQNTETCIISMLSLPDVAYSYMRVELLVDLQRSGALFNNDHIQIKGCTYVGILAALKLGQSVELSSRVDLRLVLH